LRDLHTVHRIVFVAQKSAIPVRTAPKPPPNFGLPLHLCNLQNHLHRLLVAIRIAGQPGQNHQQKLEQNFSTEISKQLLAEHERPPSFSRIGLHEILKFGRNADTSCSCNRAAASAV
jgi:hypothetical protein